MKTHEVAAACVRCLGDGKPFVVTMPAGNEAVGFPVTVPYEQWVEPTPRNRMGTPKAKGRVMRRYECDPMAVLRWMVRQRLVRLVPTDDNTIEVVDIAGKTLSIGGDKAWD